MRSNSLPIGQGRFEREEPLMSTDHFAGANRAYTLFFHARSRRTMIRCRFSTSVAVSVSAFLATFVVNSISAATLAYTAWTVPVGTATSGTSSYGSYLAVNSSGDIYIDGFTTGAIYGASNNNGALSFVAEYSRSGNLLWDQVTPGAQFNGIAVDASSNVYVGSNAEGLGAILKYNSSGTLQWSTNVGNGINGIAVSPAGNVFASAITYGSIGTNALVGNISASGQLLWTRAPDPSSPASGTLAVAVNSAGDVFATGINQNNSGGVSNSFIAEYDSTGNLLWNPQLGTAGSTTRTNGIVVDADGNVYVSGIGPSLFGETVQNSFGAFVVEYNSGGGEKWINRFQFPEGLMRMRPGPTGTVIVDSANVFLGFDSGGNSTLSVPWTAYDPDDFAYNNGNIYFASDAVEPPTNGLGGFLADIVVPEPSTFVLLAVGGVCCAIACATRRNWRSAEKVASDQPFD
jgi:hypothetical protein